MRQFFVNSAKAISILLLSIVSVNFVSVNFVSVNFVSVNFVSASITSEVQAQTVKQETEAGFNITEGFAKKLLADDEYEFKLGIRTDYYVEAYDGENFLLNQHPGKLKFRIQIEPDENTIQANTKAAVHSDSCKEGWKFKAKEKEVGELNADARLADKFSGGVKNQLVALTSAAPEEFAPQARAFHEFLSQLSVPKLDQLKKSITAPRWLFVASHYSKKKKWKTKVDLGWGKMQVSITEALDFVGNDFVQTKYEIEFEAGNKMNLQDFKESLCEFMRDNGTTAKDLNPERESAAAITRERLKKYNSVLFQN